jgi:hypothetical protein
VEILDRLLGKPTIASFAAQMIRALRIRCYLQLFVSMLEPNAAVDAQRRARNVFGVI